MFHLTHAQLQNLRQLLDGSELAAKARLYANAGRCMEPLLTQWPATLSNQAGENSSEMMLDAGHAMIEQAVSQLQDIAQARARMTRQRYAICIDCELEIEYERLLTHPTAKRCAACQILHERSLAALANPQM